MIVEELYDVLIEAGASEGKARAASRAIADMEGHFTNIQRDISHLDQKIDQKISALDQKIDQKILELNQKIDAAYARAATTPRHYEGPPSGTGDRIIAVRRLCAQELIAKAAGEPAASC